MSFNIHLPLNNVDRVNNPPLYFLQVQDSLILLTGSLWTIAYVLYTIQAYKDKSYGMPIIALCANIGWELIYGVFYPLSFAETITFIPWFLIDLVVVFSTMKFGPHQWKHAPLIAQNLDWIIGCGSVMMLAAHWAFIETCATPGEAAFWSGFSCQVLLGAASVAQLMSRNNTGGHSITIWLCRSIGSFAAVVMFSWRYAHYPQDYSFVGKPMAAFILVSVEIADLMYPLVFYRLKRRERVKVS